MVIKELRPVFSPELVQSRVQELAAEIDELYKGKPLLIICVLKGGFMFFADLVRVMKHDDVQVDFVRLSSYGSATSSSEHITFNKDVEIPLQGKDVLVVEDMIDSGLTMEFLLSTLAQRGAKSLRLAILIDKHERRKVEIKPDFVGFTLEQGFIVGCGLDYAKRFRTLPGIYEVIPE